jgi:hypothetical protein
MWLRPDDEGREHLWNVTQFLWEYILLHPQKTVIFILTSMTIWNLTEIDEDEIF